MTLATWEAEFYPTEASDFALVDSTLKDSIAIQLAATKHALRKWEGLRPEALARHGLTKIGKNVVYGHTAGIGCAVALLITSSTCSLCLLYRDVINFPHTPCKACPLAQALDTTTRSEGCSTQYVTWSLKEDPEPMIAALADLVAKLGSKYAATVSDRWRGKP